jgi:ribosome-associated protein
VEPSTEPTNSIRIGPGVFVHRSDLRFAFSRSSGPGGQNVNKLSTRAELRVAISKIVGMDEHAAGRLRAMAGRRLTQDDEIMLVADTSRSQQDNKAETVSRLTEMVLKAMVRPKTRRKTKPSRGAKERRLAGKKKDSQTKSLRQSRRSSGHDD